MAEEGTVRVRGGAGLNRGRGHGAGGLNRGHRHAGGGLSSRGGGGRGNGGLGYPRRTLRAARYQRGEADDGRGQEHGRITTHGLDNVTFAVRRGSGPHPLSPLSLRVLTPCPPLPSGEGDA